MSTVFASKFIGRVSTRQYKHKKESLMDSFLMAGMTSGFADGQHEVSPDSEETKRLNREV